MPDDESLSTGRQPKSIHGHLRRDSRVRNPVPSHIQVWSPGDAIKSISLQFRIAECTLSINGLGTTKQLTFEHFDGEDDLSFNRMPAFLSFCLGEEGEPC